jgi:putative lipoic acid-binding regulatory protein
LKNDSPPTIEFPCAYPIKVVGLNEAGFVEQIVELFREHAPEITDEHVEVRESSAQKYVSVTVTIHATGVAQLLGIHESLKRHPLIKLVL